MNGTRTDVFDLSRQVCLDPAGFAGQAFDPYEFGLSIFPDGTYQEGTFGQQVVERGIFPFGGHGRENPDGGAPVLQKHVQHTSGG